MQTDQNKTYTEQHNKFSRFRFYKLTWRIPIYKYILAGFIFVRP